MDSLLLIQKVQKICENKAKSSHLSGCNSQCFRPILWDGGAAEGECGPLLPLKHKWFPSVLMLENGGTSPPNTAPPPPLLPRLPQADPASLCNLTSAQKYVRLMDVLYIPELGCFSRNSLGPIWNSFPPLLILNETTPSSTSSPVVVFKHRPCCIHEVLRLYIDTYH